MARGDDERIRDISACVRLIGDYARLRSITTDQAHRDLLAAGVERQFEIIGEAIKRLSRDVTDRHPDVPWSDFARFRDVLAHQYHRIETANIEAAIDVQLPRLSEAIETELLRMRRDAE